MRRYAEAHGLTLDEVIDDYLKCANEFEQQDPLFDQKIPYLTKPQYLFEIMNAHQFLCFNKIFYRIRQSNNFVWPTCGV